ncbi:transposase [Candidatus Arsenophonus triatominarum]|uniref:transposase n=1 Tax=Candidatus Arsenophonus triatominarum TaxID=57911 RepID=UPI00164FEF7A|nr:transposase [Candidatus Arsenophonus triatominarum]
MLKTVIHRLARRLPCAAELFSMFGVLYANSTEKPLTMAPASFKRLSLRDVLYLGFYLKKPPVSLSRLKHYSGEDNITLRYKRPPHEKTGRPGHDIR